MSSWRKAWPVVAAVGVALALKATLLAAGVVPFDGDEAIVALMARHILRGKHTWFFYGQHYMGSLDAYLVAGTFAVLGESALAVRLVQTALYITTTATGYAVALRFTGDRQAAICMAWLLALPPVLLTLYTTVSLGGYGEILLLGNLLLWWGHRLGREDARRGWLWLTWGIVAGLGFWVLGLVAVYAAPVALWLLLRLRGRAWRGYLVAALGVALGSLPWWLGGGYVTLAEISGGMAPGAAVSGFLDSVGARLLNFFALGLPALFGLRFPWGVDGPRPWATAPGLLLYLGALAYALRRAEDGRRSERLLLGGVGAALLGGFALTPYGGDPSGRYFLPLYLPLFVFAAESLMALRARLGRWAWGLLGLVLAGNLAATVQAALAYPPGLTAHFNPVAWVDHRYDDDLIAFLRAHGGRRGYANYWVSYPIAFLSGEEVILQPRLPYKANLRYNSHDDRYAPYGEMVAASPEVVYVTTDYPPLNALLRERFAALGVTFREEQIGAYRVFYDFSRRVWPDELAIQTE